MLGFEITRKDVDETLNPNVKRLRVNADINLFGAKELPVWADVNNTELKNCSVDDGHVICEVVVQGTEQGKIIMK